MGWRVALAVHPPMLRNKVAIVTGANAGLGRDHTGPAAGAPLS